MRLLTIKSEAESVTLADFSRLKTRYPYIMMLPQVRFLELLQRRLKVIQTFN